MKIYKIKTPNEGNIWAVVCLELKTHLCKTVFDFIVEFIEEVDGEDVAVESGWEVVEVAEC